MSLKFLQKHKILRDISCKISNAQSNEFIGKFENFLSPGENILDIGAGSCTMAAILSKKKYRITPLDIVDFSLVEEIKPILYDGKRFPFDDNSFNVSLLITVLHHTPHPEEIIKEATRVAKRIIIMEDIYLNSFHKYLTYFFDSLLNFEFLGHPHTNKNDSQWRLLFADLGLKIVGVKYSSRLLVFKHATYSLKTV